MVFFLGQGFLEVSGHADGRPGHDRQSADVLACWAARRGGVLGGDEAMALLHVYMELIAGSEDAAAAYPGDTAHLAACGPSGEDFAGLLAAVTGGPPG